ncbi:MAG: DUF4349 domain-containing protein [bacterium]|nr:DUF4349 domain-containing protein [bacterium]
MEQKTIRVSRKKLFWIVIILIIIGLWWAYQEPRYQILPAMMSGGYGVSDIVSPSTSAPKSPIMENLGAIYPDYYRQNPDITDTRQFLKTSFSAEIKTRDVKDMVRDVRGIIRDVEGRIDNAQESEKYSYVSFVVPKSRFDAFRDEIENLTHERLITVNESSENLLGQKQSIEEQMQNATSTLADLQKQKIALATRHNQTLASLNAQLVALQNQVPYPTEQAFAIQQNIDSENKSYSSQNQNLANSINQYKALITGIEKQDTQFANNIETVNGYISVNWVTYWQVTKIFSPIHPSIILIILAIILWKVLGRAGVVPKIELV